MSNFLKKILPLGDKYKVNKKTDNIQSNVKDSTRISKSIKDNRLYIESCFSDCFDLVIREISLFNTYKKEALIVYLEGLSEKKLIDDFLVTKLTSEADINNAALNEDQLIKYKLGIKDGGVHEDMEKSVEAILSGNPVIFADGLEKSFEINLSNPPGRAVEEPSAEVVTRGPREGFTESIVKNIALIRKRIKNSNLKMERFVIGKETNTTVIISYISNLADEKIVNEIRKRLKIIDIQSVLDSNYIEEYISDRPFSIFPSVYHTEKPDVAAGKILEGRVIIMADGSPVAISVPALFVEFIQSGEDYYIKYSSATLNRLIRYISLVITVSLPSLYVAIVSFHQEIIPTKLLISIMGARTTVPVSAFMESIFMLMAFEIMREAGIRMPKTLGPAISIVGGLVLGDAAVRAGLVGNPMVVVVALTAITKFTISSVEMEIPIVYIRFLFLVLSGYLGLVGLTCGVLLVGMRLVSIRSFGLPYMYPICPFNISSGEDVILRAPMFNLSKTQRLIKLRNDFISRRIHKRSGW